jgi:hypothetical protein
MGQGRLKAVASILMFSGIYLAVFASAIQSKFAIQDIVTCIVYENGQLKPFEWNLDGRQFPISAHVKITDINREFLLSHKPIVFEYHTKVGQQFVNKNVLQFSSLTKIVSRTAFLGDDTYNGTLFKIKNPIHGKISIVPFSNDIDKQRIRTIELKLFYEVKSVIRDFYKLGIPLFFLGVFLLHRAHIREMAHIANREESIGGKVWGRRKR